ncbi:MAG: CUAEP/CCAEP-tail radical SAM protein [Caldilineaceae bacterium]|nr:CUAEP/CCAEP-tail radical SAM protein [Caldilineaceae bacterium]
MIVYNPSAFELTNIPESLEAGRGPSVPLDKVPMHSSILLISCYELGHQPLSLAWPLAALRAVGLDAATADLAVEDFPAQKAAASDLIAIAVPMHTALRIGLDAAQKARALNPNAHLCIFGLYAWLNRSYLLQLDGSGRAIADSVVAGETEPVLVALAQALSSGSPPADVPGLTTSNQEASPHLGRHTLPVPDRNPLPSLDSYAHYVPGSTAATNGSATGNGQEVEDPVAYPAGYTEATRGCLHTCRHCPVVPVYNGRFFVVPVETVLADIAQQVDNGARHITFGDPDFLNGPGHARKVARALHGAFPQVSFDFTAKVEHLLKHRRLLPELAEHGASFVVSAFESTSDRVLSRLQKGHTRRHMEEALAAVDEAGLSIQPTWMPFTPWTSLDDYLFMLRWIRQQGLIPHVPAVQLSIRMLVPPGSALLSGEDADEWKGTLDAANFTYRWQHPDPRMDALQQQVARIAEMAGQYETEGSSGAGGGNLPDPVRDAASPLAVFHRIECAAHNAAGRPPPALPPLSAYMPRPPHLTEHWFC